MRRIPFLVFSERFHVDMSIPEAMADLTFGNSIKYVIAMSREL